MTDDIKLAAVVESLEDRTLLVSRLLDPSFGAILGTVSEPIGLITDIAIQADGKILVVGAPGGSGESSLVRYESDGLRDESFGTDGSVDVFAVSVLVQPDGMIVTAGLNPNAGFPGDTPVEINRFHPDGTLEKTFEHIADTTFTAGEVAFGISKFTKKDRLLSGPKEIREHFYAGEVSDDLFGAKKLGLAIQPDGKVVVAGTHNGGDNILLVRYDTDGNLDSTFGTGTGTVFMPIEGGEVVINDVEISIDPVTGEYKPLVVGKKGTGNDADIFLARFREDGRLDNDNSNNNTHLTENGWTVLDIAEKYDTAESLVIQPDGSIVVVGNTDGIGRDYVVARFHADGTVDETFNATGRIVGNFGGHDFAHDVALKPDGTIVVVGDNVAREYNYNTFVLEFNTSGLELARSGFDTFGNDPPWDDRAWAVAIQADGKIVTGGHNDPAQHVTSTGGETRTFNGQATVTRYYHNRAQIEWTNRGRQDNDPDFFAEHFGSGVADVARRVVDAAISSWESVISDFNFQGGRSKYQLKVYAFDLAQLSTFAPIPGHPDKQPHVLATTLFDSVDSGGAPINNAVIVDDDPAGNRLILDATPTDPFYQEGGTQEFSNHRHRFHGRSDALQFRQDMYTLILHEIGHALGFQTEPSDGIWTSLADFLTPDPKTGGTPPYTFVGAGTGTVTFSGTGHLDDDASNHPDVLMNAGVFPRTRLYVSDLEAKILADAYGYSIIFPSTVQTFLATLNQSNGELIVRHDPETVENEIAVSADGVYWHIDVNGVQFSYRADRVNKVTIEGDKDFATEFVINIAPGVVLPNGGVSITGGSHRDKVTINGSFRANAGNGALTIDTGFAEDEITLNRPAFDFTEPGGTINAGPGDDKVFVNGVYSAADTQWTVNDAESFVVNGIATPIPGGTTTFGLTGGGITINQGSTADLVFNWNSMGGVQVLGTSDADALTVDFASGLLADVEFDGGTGGDDSLSIVGTPGNDTIVETANLFSFNGTSITFNNVDCSAVEVQGGAGDDTFIVDGGCTTLLGGPDNDTFTVNSTGTSELILDGQDGSDTYTIHRQEIKGLVTVDDSSTAPIDIDTVTLIGQPPEGQPDVTVLGLPTVDAGPDESVDEGAAIQLSASFFDSDTADTHTATIDWGDGTVEEATVLQNSGEVTGSHIFLDDGTYTVTFSVMDSQGDVGNGSMEITVDNVPPIVDGFVETNRFQAPANLPSALTSDGTRLFLADNSGFRTIFELDTDGSVIDSFLAPSTTFVESGAFDGFGNPNGLAFDGSHLFVADLSGTIFEVDAAGTTIFNTFSAPFRPGGMTYDGSQLYVSDVDSHNVAVYSTDGTLVRNFNALHRPAGLTFRDGSLFSIDISSQMIFEFTTDGTLINTTQGPHHVVDGIGGITFAGANLYIAEVSDPDRFNPPVIPGTIVELASLATARVDQTVQEGELVTLDGAFVDPGSHDTHTFLWQVSADNGQVIADGTSQDYSFTPSDNGSYTVTYTVTDDDGGVGTDTVEITVDNVPPIADGFVETNRFQAPADLPSALTSDGTHLFLADNNGFRTIFELETDGAVVHSFLAPSTTFVASGAFDGFGNPNGLAFDGSHLFVADLSGTVFEVDAAGTTLFSTFSTPFRPGGMTYDGSQLYISDVDSHDVSVYTTDGTLVRNFNAPHRPAGLTFRDGSLFSIDISSQMIFEFTTDGTLINTTQGPHRVVDGIGGITFAGASLYIAEVSDPDRFNPPVIPGTIIELASLATARVDQTVQEGELVTLDGFFVDPGSNDTHTFLWQVSADNGQVIADGTAQDYSFTPSDNGSYTVTYTVTDDDGGVGTDTVEITVDNVPPTVIANEGSGAFDIVTGMFHFENSGSFTDPGLLDSWTVGVDWGDGTSSNSDDGTGQVVLNADKTFQLFHDYIPDQSTVYAIQISVTDDDAGVGRPASGELIVSGSAGDDTIEIISGSVIVIINGQVAGTFEEISNILLDAGDGSDSYAIPLGVVNAVTITDSGTSGIDTIAIEQTEDEVTIVVSGDRVTSGSHSITFGSDVESLELDAGEGGATVIVESTPTASLTVASLSDLVIHGTPADDEIAFARGRKSGEIEVTVNGVRQGTFAPTERIIAYGGDGNDKIHVAARIGLSAWLYGGAGIDVLKGGGGDDVILGGEGDDKLFGRRGIDRILGESGNDWIWGGKGGDTLDGGTGHDTIFGLLGDDHIYGGEGDDNLTGGSGDDYIDGGDGNDRLWGNAGDDQILGGDGDDVLLGGRGDDKLDGEEGDDFLFGGRGNDMLEGREGLDLVFEGWQWIWE